VENTYKKPCRVNSVESRVSGSGDHSRGIAALAAVRDSITNPGTKVKHEYKNKITAIRCIVFGSLIPLNFVVFGALASGLRGNSVFRAQRIAKTPNTISDGIEKKSSRDDTPSACGQK
jgi:hypothetical protein